MGTYTIFVIMLIGLLAGALGGALGVGGGIVMVPLLVLIGFSQHQAQGISLATMLPPVTILAVMNYNNAGHMNWKYAMLMSLTFVIGGYLGSKFAIHINERLLKKIFGVVMLIASMKMIFNK